MLDDEMKWKVLPPMPKPNSHIEFAWVLVNNSIVIAGGTTEKHPETKKMVLNGEVVQFNLNTMVHTSLIKLLGKLFLLLHICSYYKSSYTKKDPISVITACHSLEP